MIDNIFHFRENGLVGVFSGMQVIILIIKLIKNCKHWIIYCKKLICIIRFYLTEFFKSENDKS